MALFYDEHCPGDPQSQVSIICTKFSKACAGMVLGSASMYALLYVLRKCSFVKKAGVRDLSDAGHGLALGLVLSSPQHAGISDRNGYELYQMTNGKWPQAATVEHKYSSHLVSFFPSIQEQVAGPAAAVAAEAPVAAEPPPWPEHQPTSRRRRIPPPGSAAAQASLRSSPQPSPPQPALSHLSMLAGRPTGSPGGP